MAKKALCIGINYLGTENELRGCIHDADDWAKLLGTNGFSPAVLAEKQATRVQILSAMKVLVGSLDPGDVGFITFSGHGTWVPDYSGDEPDRRDEALCPVDMGDDGANLIVDDELKPIFALLPTAAHLVFVTDCCHSGSIYRMVVPPAEARSAYRRPRLIPPAHFARTTSFQAKVDRAYGQAPRSNAALPGVIHLSGCKDSETSCDAEINGRPCGALSYFATRAFGRAAALGQSYAEAHAAIRRHLPNYDFQQTPQLNASADLKRTKVFG